MVEEVVMAKKKARKSSVKKKPKLRSKPLADLPAKKKRAARVKGGALTLATDSPAAVRGPLPTPAFAPPYVPVRVLGTDLGQPPRP
jgi:hypothetical protein